MRKCLEAYKLEYKVINNTNNPAAIHAARPPDLLTFPIEVGASRPLLLDVSLRMTLVVSELDDDSGDGTDGDSGGDNARETVDIPAVSVVSLVSSALMLVFCENGKGPVSVAPVVSMSLSVLLLACCGDGSRLISAISGPFGFPSALESACREDGEGLVSVTWEVFVS